jgi:hypothetical protein
MEEQGVLPNVPKDIYLRADNIQRRRSGTCLCTGVNRIWKVPCFSRPEFDT